MALVEVARYFRSFEANLAKARLDAADIPSFLFDLEMQSAGIVPARLMVDAEDLNEARALLDEPPV